MQAIQNPHTSVLMLMAQKNFEDADGSLIIKVSAKQGEYKILSVEHTQKVLPPLENIDPQLEDLIFQLTGEDGALLGAGALAKPNSMKSIIAYENALFDQECKAKWEPDMYYLRFPYNDAMRFLNLFEQKTDHNGRLVLNTVANLPIKVVS